MRFFRLAVLAFTAGFAMPATMAVAKPHPTWTATVTLGEGGSHVLGNPDAKVKLTEFISYTCPHCAHFHQESDAPLKLGYVMPGKVSIEVRHLVRDPVDLTVALLTNCGEPKRFFRNHDAFLQSQPSWLKIMETASDGQKQRWTKGNLGTRMQAIAGDFGFYQMMEQRGYDRAALDRCLSDEAMAKKLAAQTQAAVAAGVKGTPSFMLNGTLLDDTYDWETLSPQVQARL
jgi:protein-disulfide isomerase